MPRLTRVDYITSLCPDCDDVHLVIEVNSAETFNRALGDSDWDTLSAPVAILRKERDEAMGKAQVAQ